MVPVPKGAEPAACSGALGLCPPPQAAVPGPRSSPSHPLQHRHRGTAPGRVLALAMAGWAGGCRACQAKNGEESCIPWVPVWKESTDPRPVFQSIWFLCGLMGTLNGRHHVLSLGISCLCGEASDEQFSGVDTGMTIRSPDCGCREQACCRTNRATVPAGACGPVLPQPWAPDRGFDLWTAAVRE